MIKTLIQKNTMIEPNGNFGVAKISISNCHSLEKGNPVLLFWFVVSILAISVFSFLPNTVSAGTISLPPNNLGLVGYWSFEDATGTVATDFSGNGNTGILTNGPTWTNGKIGKALDFDGADDYVVTSSDIPSLGSSYSSSAFVKVSSSGSVKVINEVRPVNGDDYHLAYQLLLDTDNSPYAVQYNGSTWRGVVSSESLVTGRWYNIAATYDGSNIKIYVNGVLRGSNTASGNIHHESGQKLIVGKQIVGSGYYPYLGQIDEVRIYSRALSATEITNLYNQSNKIRKIQSSQSNILRDGLVGYWSFDGSDISGTTAYDRSGNANNGTLTNGPTVAIGKVGQALQFDGVNDYVEGSFSSSVSGNVSASFWFKGSTQSSNNRMIDIAQADDVGIQVYLAPIAGNSVIGIDNSGGPSSGINSITTGLNDNSWHHVVVIRDGTTYKLYLDGEYEAQGSGTAPTYTRYRIGKHYATDSYFDGSLDEVRIYNRALSTSEIQTLYKSGEAKIQASQNTKLTSGLVGLWSFDGPDISGTTAYDRSGNGNNGTLTNGPTVAIGKVGQAMSFDGTNDQISVPHNSVYNFSTGDFTISTWIKTTSSVSASIVNKFAATGGGGQMAILFSNAAYGAGSGKILAYTYNGGPEVYRPSSSVVNDGNWHNIIISRSGTTLNIYIDGALSNGTQTGSSALNVNSDGQIGIGYSGYDTAGYFNGSLDEVRIYNRALSASEVQMLYNMGR